MNREIEEKKHITAAIDKIKNQVDMLIDIYEEREEYEICDILVQYRDVVLPRMMENYVN